MSVEPPDLLTATGAGGVNDPAWRARRPALLRVCAGEPLLIHDSDEDLVALVNQAAALFDVIIDRELDPDDLKLAEVIVERICDRHGIDRVGDGERIVDLASHLGRYLIPEAVELDRRLAAARRGVGRLKIHDLKRVPMMLAGDAVLPAATVAGDVLDRVGYRCLWLNRGDAARVTRGGKLALEAAIRGLDMPAALPVRQDVRTGKDVISPSDLRAAELLIERDPTRPHGLAPSTAGSILSTLSYSLERAQTHGANLRGKFEFTAIPTLPENRVRPPVAKEDYVSLQTVHDVCDQLGIVTQVCLWIMRLVGLRISETFGLQVHDFWRDPDSGHGRLHIHKQGGAARPTRDRKTGQIVTVTMKVGLKADGERIIPIVEPLANLIEAVIDIFHTAPDGTVRTGARLLPGTRDADQGGPDAVRRQLAAALKSRGIKFTPHTMRAALIDDLDRRNVRERVRFAYVGHKHPRQDIQRSHYISAPRVDEYTDAVAAITAQFEDELADLQLQVPTTIRQRWHDAVCEGLTRDTINLRLTESGWLLPKGTDNDPLLDAHEVAHLLGCSTRSASKYMRDGVLPTENVAWGRRHVRHARMSDAVLLKEVLTLPTISDLAQELKQTYHQTWHLVQKVTAQSSPGASGHEPGSADQSDGRRVRLSKETADRVRGEHARREAFLKVAVPAPMAAELLSLTTTLVGTLVKSKKLERVDAPDWSSNARECWVSRASIAQYLRQFPVRDLNRRHPEGPLLPLKDAASVMGITRPVLSKLSQTRQIEYVAKPRSSSNYVAAADIERWARREGSLRTLSALREWIDSHRPSELSSQHTGPHEPRRGAWPVG